MRTDKVRPLLDRFSADASRVVPLEALWAHGSLALGDFQPGRSDLDLIALVGASRRELSLAGLCLAGLCLLGLAPAGLVPDVTDEELAEYIRADLRDFWYPATARPEPWLRDIWVDLGLLTLARAIVTLQQGRLITKKEALEVLAGLGAPADVLRDIYQRRYEIATPISPQWRAQRGVQARTFVRAGIERLFELPDEADG
jgi:hypothetical protein